MSGFNDYLKIYYNQKQELTNILPNLPQIIDYYVQHRTLENYAGHIDHLPKLEDFIDTLDILLLKGTKVPL